MRVLNSFYRKQRPIFIWAAAALFYLYEVVLRVSPSVMTDELMQHFKISATTLGWLTTSYFMAYFVLQIPCGLIVDRFGARKVVGVSSLICASGTLVFCFSDSLSIAIMGRLLIGVGSSCAFLCCLKLATDWFTPKRFALIASLTNMMGTLGATFAATPLALLIHEFGWQEACYFLSSMGILFSTIGFGLIVDRSDRCNQHSVRDALLHIIKAPQIPLIGFIGGILYLPIVAFAELWGVPFMMRTYDIDSAVASQATLMIFLGTAIGSPIFAIIAGKIKSYHRTMMISGLLASMLFLVVTNARHLEFTYMYYLLFAIGFAIGAQVLTFTIARNHAPEPINATTMGFTNACVSLVGLIFQPLLGFVLDLFWEGNVSEIGVRIYTSQTYQYAIYTLPVILVVSVFLLYFVKETYNQDNNI